MNRRTFITTASTLTIAATAGCSALNQNEETPTPTETPTDTGTEPTRTLTRIEITEDTTPDGIKTTVSIADDGLPRIQIAYRNTTDEEYTIDNDITAGFIDKKPTQNEPYKLYPKSFIDSDNYTTKRDTRVWLATESYTAPTTGESVTIASQDVFMTVVTLLRNPTDEETIEDYPERLTFETEFSVGPSEGALETATLQFDALFEKVETTTTQTETN